MVKRIGKILLYVMLWAAVVAYIVYASILVFRHNSEQRVSGVAIEVADSTETDILLTADKIKANLLKEGVSVINSRTSDVDVARIRRMVTRNGFVAHTNIYTTYNGVLHIDVEQRKPIMRLMVDGYDLYITAEGAVFRAPESGTLYVPIVTGRYKPLFASSFEGTLDRVADSLKRKAEERVREIAIEKIPLYEREEQLLAERKATKNRSISKGFFELNKEFKARRKAFKAEQERDLQYIDGHLRDCRNALKEVTLRQQEPRRQLAREMAQLADLRALIDFVGQVQQSDFWRAEVVQIIVSQNSAGRIEVELIPRSGNFRLAMGELEDVGRKLNRAKEAYDHLISPLGENRYKIINIRYDNQIVCTEE